MMSRGSAYEILRRWGPVNDLLTRAVSLVVFRGLWRSGSLLKFYTRLSLAYHTLRHTAVHGFR